MVILWQLGYDKVQSSHLQPHLELLAWCSSETIPSPAASAHKPHLLQALNVVVQRCFGLGARTNEQDLRLEKGDSCRQGQTGSVPEDVVSGTFAFMICNLYQLPQWNTTTLLAPLVFRVLFSIVLHEVTVGPYHCRPGPACFPVTFPCTALIFQLGVLEGAMSSIAWSNHHLPKKESKRRKKKDHFSLAWAKWL